MDVILTQGDFYIEVLLCFICYASQYTQVSNTPTPGSKKERRCKRWFPLTAGELLVWIGISLKMGTLGRSRVSHYWSNEPGFGDDIIKSCMNSDRYMDIAANLAFAPRGTARGWPKLEWLDGVLKAACQAACGITQHFTVDESMIKLLSRFCAWIQYMPKKPIKRGLCLRLVSERVCPID